jgi:hypothetical protein
MTFKFGKIGDDGFHLEVLAVNSCQVRFVFKVVSVLKVDLERGLLVTGQLHQGFVHASREVAGVSGWTIWCGDDRTAVKDMETIGRDSFGMLEGDPAADPACAESEVHSPFARGFECGPGAFRNSVFTNQCAVDVNQDEFDHSREYR